MCPSKLHPALIPLVLLSSMSVGLFHPKFLKVTIKGFAKGTPELNKPNTEIQSSQLHTITEAFHPYSPGPFSSLNLNIYDLLFPRRGYIHDWEHFQNLMARERGEGSFLARCQCRLRPMPTPFPDSQWDNQWNIKRSKLLSALNIIERCSVSQQLQGSVLDTYRWDEVKEA